MKRGTPEYKAYMAEARANADEKLRQAYRTYKIDQLMWDWGCNISQSSREILEAELVRRGIPQRSMEHTPQKARSLIQ
jgi:hypothetical protein